jgi:peptidoglycan/xylan/chitin deacetylase (PgdA/CDA1 family)
MIGVVANEDEHPVVVEFFELFKTPWEFYRPGTHYEVLLCSNRPVPENNARLLLLYGAQQQAFEQYQGIKTRAAPQYNSVCFRGERLPIYGSCLLFDGARNEVLTHEGTKSAATVSMTSGPQAVVRLGFDLFEEVRHLFTLGQPAEFAGIPTLELHISLLRDLIVSQGITLVEILPVPAGHRFIVCLTHDVDHPRVRYHKCDHTMFGFIYRALVSSAINFCRGRRSLRQVATNWKAAFSLPLVFAGLAKDFWDQLDQYLELEQDLSSTFFVIPTKGDTGIDSHGRARRRRASRYALADIADDLKKLLSANREIAVHGIDAWRDSAKGRNECERIKEIAGTSYVGVRVHWLYFNSQAPSILEEAGFSYDSTVGYNETIGYRAGTTQVFKHPNVDHLLELPLHIMDTALFYPSYMNLSDEQAGAAMRPLIENALKFGGVLTINWHDRSVGPERLWGNAYTTLLRNLRARRPWFATAGQAVSWFRRRRATSFASVTQDSGNIRVQPGPNPTAAELPPLTLRVYNSGASRHNLRRLSSTAFEDFTIDKSDPMLIAA